MGEKYESGDTKLVGSSVEISETDIKLKEILKKNGTNIPKLFATIALYKVTRYCIKKSVDATPQIIALAIAYKTIYGDK